MIDKQIKKADSVIAADSNGTYIIDDYLKFVKGDTQAVKNLLEEIEDEEILCAVLEYIMMRSVEVKDKMGERSLKMFLKKLDDICTLQGIQFQFQRKQVQLMMIQKAVCSKWLSVFPLTQSELNLIVQARKTDPFEDCSFNYESIKRKFNRFD